MYWYLSRFLTGFLLRPLVSCILMMGSYKHGGYACTMPLFDGWEFWTWPSRVFMVQQAFQRSGALATDSGTLLLGMQQQAVM